MFVNITFDWSYESGLLVEKFLPMVAKTKSYFEKRSYGNSISEIFMVLTCSPYHFKQRKLFRRALKLFSYDIIFDFFLIKDSNETVKKKIIFRQMTEITEQTFLKYKFDDFDTEAFLSDFKAFIQTVEGEF